MSARKVALKKLRDRYRAEIIECVSHVNSKLKSQQKSTTSAPDYNDCLPKKLSDIAKALSASHLPPHTIEITALPSELPPEPSEVDPAEHRRAEARREAARREEPWRGDLGPAAPELSRVESQWAEPLRDVHEVSEQVKLVQQDVPRPSAALSEAPSLGNALLGRAAGPLRSDLVSRGSSDTRAVAKALFCSSTTFDSEPSHQGFPQAAPEDPEDSLGGEDLSSLGDSQSNATSEPTPIPLPLHPPLLISKSEGEETPAGFQHLAAPKKVGAVPRPMTTRVVISKPMHLPPASLLPFGDHRQVITQPPATHSQKMPLASRAPPHPEPPARPPARLPARPSADPTAAPAAAPPTVRPQPVTIYGIPLQCVNGVPTCYAALGRPPGPPAKPTHATQTEAQLVTSQTFHYEPPPISNQAFPYPARLQPTRSAVTYTTWKQPNVPTTYAAPIFVGRQTIRSFGEPQAWQPINQIVGIRKSPLVTEDVQKMIGARVHPITSFPGLTHHSRGMSLVLPIPSKR